VFADGGQEGVAESDHRQPASTNAELEKQIAEEKARSRTGERRLN
jgi:hypothetical protein